VPLNAEPPTAGETRLAGLIVPQPDDVYHDIDTAALLPPGTILRDNAERAWQIALNPARKRRPYMQCARHHTRLVLDSAYEASREVWEAIRPVTVVWAPAPDGADS